MMNIAFSLTSKQSLRLEATTEEKRNVIVILSANQKFIAVINWALLPGQNIADMTPAVDYKAPFLITIIDTALNVLSLPASMAYRRLNKLHTLELLNQRA